MGQGTLGGDVESQGWSGALHLPVTENASMSSIPSKWHLAMFQSWLYRTPKPNIVCTSILANMHWARYSPRCKTRQRRYWVILDKTYMMQRHVTLHMTENYWASKMRYHTANSTYMEPTNHFWYTWILPLCICSLLSHTSLCVRWISWQLSMIRSGKSSTSQVSRIT